MTCLEKYKQHNPGYTEYDYYDVIRNTCPHSHDAIINIERPDWCSIHGVSNVDICELCWNREIPEENTPVCDCYNREYERCNGTKERDKCSCKGVESQCDFYPEKRGETEKKTIAAHMPPFDTVEDSVSEATKSEEIEARCCSGRLIIGDEEVEHPDTDFPKILDSGNRREFETGAVRDIQEGKGRCDLMPLDVVAKFVEYPVNINVVIESISEFQKCGDTDYLYKALDFFSYEIGANKQKICLEVSKHFEEGAKKYGEHNWQKGIPTNCYIDSAVRHYLKFLRGDTDEPHDRAFVWNLLCCIWTCKHKPELNVYRKEEPVDG